MAQTPGTLLGGPVELRAGLPVTPSSEIPLSAEIDIDSIVSAHLKRFKEYFSIKKTVGDAIFSLVHPVTGKAIGSIKYQGLPAANEELCFEKPDTRGVIETITLTTESSAFSKSSLRRTYLGDEENSYEDNSLALAARAREIADILMPL